IVPHKNLHSFPTRRSSDLRKRLFKNPGAVAGLVILCCIILMAIFAPMFSKFDYKTQNIRHTKVPPKMPIVSSLGIMDGKNSDGRSEEHTSELQSRFDLVCR